VPGEIIFVFTFASKTDAMQFLDSGFWAVVLAMAVVAFGGAIHVIAGFL
jgi:hypothetical protein